MRTTDEITYIFREFNTDKPDEAIVEALNHAMRNSVGLVSPKVVNATFSDRYGDWYGDDEGAPVPEIRVTVAGS